MTDREVFFETVRFGKPDRMLFGVPSYGLGYMGVNHQGFDDNDHDDGHNKPVGAKWVDIWGTGWEKEYPDVMGFPKINPLAEMSALSTYNWPDPNDERICSKIYEDKARYTDMDLIINGSHRDTLWEKAYMLVGMENMMDYFYSEPDYARTVLHKIMDFQMGIAEHYIKNGVEMVGLGDDLGCQDRLLLSPYIINEFLAPEYKRLFDFYKDRDVLIGFHSCGHVEPILELFIELGVNILNPMQATANDFRRVISVTKGRMAILGGISTKIIMEGSDDDIRAVVKETIGILGAYGGYFCSADQGMPFTEHSIEVLRDSVTSYPIGY